MFLSCLLAAAVQATPASDTPAAPRIDLTVVDVPYNVMFGGRGPSMAQSLDLTVSAYVLVHGGIRRALPCRPKVATALTVLYDLGSMMEVTLPLTDVWVHEEFHRAQMGRRGIGSFDDVYRFRLNSEAIPVSHVRDAHLIDLKRDHPAELVRMNSAGIEGELLLVRALEWRQFQTSVRVRTRSCTGWRSYRLPDTSRQAPGRKPTTTRMR